MVVIVGPLVGGIMARHHTNAVSGLRRLNDTVAVVTAPLSKRAELSLPDGSTVTLGPGSTLSYPVDFDRRREVRLDGQAHFRVTPIPAHPFFVSLGTLGPNSASVDRPYEARLDGTSRLRTSAAAWHAFSVRTGEAAGAGFRNDFVVRAYPEDAYPRVAVREGAVALSEQVIGPGELGRLSTNGEPVVETADTAVWFSWTTGKLTFTSAFRDALPRLNRFYDLDLRVADSSLSDVVLVASLPDTLVAGTLDVIALALAARMEQRGRVVTFYRAGLLSTSRRSYGESF
jgi:transmembrane sensor